MSKTETPTPGLFEYKVHLENGSWVRLRSPCDIETVTRMLGEQHGGGYVYDDRVVIPVRRVMYVELVEHECSDGHCLDR